MAENFASFEYKTMEEVLTVIKYLTNILSTTGMQLLEIVSPSHLLTHLHGKVPQETMITTVRLRFLFVWWSLNMCRMIAALRSRILKAYHRNQSTRKSTNTTYLH
jgi:hypothetical protein